jgi:hypothetical protein
MNTTEIVAGEFLRNDDAVILRDIWFARVMAERGERSSTRSSPTKSKVAPNVPCEPFIGRYSAERVP